MEKYVREGAVEGKKNDVFQKAFGKSFVALEPEERQFLFEHYKRCEQFWRHWTTTIWSIPSVASAINIAAYMLVFTKNLEVSGKIIASGVLLLLNLALTLGLWKHQNMQKRFGDQIISIEEYASVPVIDLGRVQKYWSGSWAYVLAMIFITVTSLFFHVSNLLILSGLDIVSNLAYLIPLAGFFIIVAYLVLAPIRACWEHHKHAPASKLSNSRGRTNGKS